MKTLPKSIITLFFLIGLFSAITFRTIVIFNHIDPSWVRPAWYVGTVGYLVFFLYRFHITKKRRDTIKDHKLLQKCESGEDFSKEDRVAVKYLLNSITKSKEILNYLFIFGLSLVAIAVDLYLSFVT